VGLRQALVAEASVEVGALGVGCSPGGDPSEPPPLCPPPDAGQRCSCPGTIRRLYVRTDVLRRPIHRVVGDPDHLIELRTGAVLIGHGAALPKLH